MLDSVGVGTYRHQVKEVVCVAIVMSEICTGDLKNEMSALCYFPKAHCIEL